MRNLWDFFLAWGNVLKNLFLSCCIFQRKLKSIIWNWILSSSNHMGSVIWDRGYANHYSSAGLALATSSAMQWLPHWYLSPYQFIHLGHWHVKSNPIKEMNQIHMYVNSDQTLKCKSYTGWWSKIVRLWKSLILGTWMNLGFKIQALHVNTTYLHWFKAKIC